MISWNAFFSYRNWERHPHKIYFVECQCILTYFKTKVSLWYDILFIDVCKKVSMQKHPTSGIQTLDTKNRFTKKAHNIYLCIYRVHM